MKVVIDTNVVISAGLGSKTCAEAILRATSGRIIEPGIVVEELNRLRAKLEGQAKYGKSVKNLSAFMEYFLAIVEILDDYKLVGYSTDLPDNHFISLAASKRALLITGDKLCLETALFNKVRCKTPTQYLSEIAKEMGR